MKCADLDFFVYPGSHEERGKLILSLGHSPHSTRIVMDAETATILADEIMRAVNKTPRDRVGTPADLGCAVL